MNPLVFRTAIPFGYLFFFGALLGVMVLGIGLAVTGWRKTPMVGLRIAVGLGLFVFGAVVLWINVSAEDSLDLNPSVTSASLTGEWMDKEAGMALLADGRYECKGERDCVSLGNHGTWSLKDDFDLEFVSTDKRKVQRRVVRYRGKLRLSTQLGDPDAWDGKKTFEHYEPPASLKFPGE